MPGSELINTDEKEAVMKVFDNGGILFAHGNDGKRSNYYVRDFESDLKNYFKCSYVQCASSGSSATYIALKALGVGPGDEVITQAFNFIATVEAIVLAGATPVVCGVDDTLNMDPGDLKRCISDRTKAIVPVHMLGVPARMSDIQDIAKDNNIHIVEDACEAVGASYNNKYVGTLGDLGVFSFDFGKNITTGEGGCILTNDQNLYCNSRAIHDHGHAYIKPKDRGNDPCIAPGFNFRMTEISGAIGSVQLCKLEFILHENKLRYKKMLLLHELKAIKLRDIPGHATPSYDTFVLNCEDSILRDKLVHFLNDSGIGTKNLPGAIIWHCSVNWKHLIKPNNNLASQQTLDKLNTHIAIPILLEKSVEFYAEIAIKMHAIIEQHL